jgi:basic membrane protein A
MNRLRIALLSVLIISMVISAGCGQKPAEEAAKLKVAVVFPERISGSQFLELIHDGAQEAAKDFGDKMELKVVESSGLEECEENLRAMAKAGYDLVCTAAFSTATILEKVASEYPDTKFMTIDATIDLPNVRSAVFREHEGCFQMGMLAALMTKTGKVGYVGASDSPFGSRWEYGYEQGAKYVNPDIQVFDARVGSYKDPARAKELALAHFSQGCDVIQAAAAGGNYGVFEAAKEKGFYTFSVDIDECHLDPDHIIGSMIKKSDVAIYDGIKGLVEGNFETGAHSYGVKEGGVGLCLLLFDDHPKNAVPQDVLDKIEEARKKIASGEIEVIDYVELQK